MKSPSNRIIGLIVVILIGAASGLGYTIARNTESGEPTPADSNLIKSSEVREENILIEESTLENLVEGNNRFAFNFYHSITKSGKNLFYSPYSISLAMAMSYAGARGETADQISEVLNFELPKEKLHRTFNCLDQSLTKRGENENFKLNVANAFWGQENYDFRKEYLDILARNYGAGIRLLNFQEKPEPSRVRINEWVENHTENKIKNLLPPGSITPATRAVLTNAIYFNASWKNPFQESDTKEDEFTLLEGETVEVPMMSQTNSFRYVDSGNYQAIKLPYHADMSMVVMIPSRNNFQSFEEDLSEDKINGIIQKMEKKSISLKFPKFEYSSKEELSNKLSKMGMSKALGNGADFSGMTGDKSLFIDKILHKAYVSVDEKGTEAAAATAAVMPTSAPTSPIEVTVDNPFIFFIRDDRTDSALFVGRVLDPSS